jgi:hypothetical protein
MDRRRSEVDAGSLALDSCSRRWNRTWHPYLGSDWTYCLALSTTNKNFGCMPRSISTSVISRPIPRLQLAPVWHAGLGMRNQFFGLNSVKVELAKTASIKHGEATLP